MGFFWFLSIEILCTELKKQNNYECTKYCIILRKHNKKSFQLMLYNKMRYSETAVGYKHIGISL